MQIFISVPVTVFKQFMAAVFLNNQRYIINSANTIIHLVQIGILSRTLL
jgi:hypothetical protein